MDERKILTIQKCRGLDVIHRFDHYNFECYTKFPDKERGETSNIAEKQEVETLLMAVKDNKEFHLDVWYGYMW